MSSSHRIPFDVPLAETEGETAGKANVSGVWDVGAVEMSPEPPALKEKAFTWSAVLVVSLSLPK